jgi:hypothetical protein
MPKKETIPTSIRFDVETFTAIEEMATRERRSLSHQVQYLVDLGMQARSQQQSAAA